MSDEIDYSNLPDFPKRIPEKLKTIRKRLALSPDQIAPRVGAQSGEEILAYERDEGEISVTIVICYARAFGVPWENIIDDRRDLWFGDRQN